MVLFGVFLTHLCTTGRVDLAEHYATQVKAHFYGVISDQELFGLDVDDIATILATVRRVLAKSALPSAVSPLQAYVDELQSKGFTVVVSERYRHLL